MRETQKQGKAKLTQLKHEAVIKRLPYSSCHSRYIERHLPTQARQEVGGVGIG